MVPWLTIVCGSLLLSVAALALILLKRRAWKALAVTGAVVFGTLFAMFRPVCAPIPKTELHRFSPPIEDRTDTNFYGMKTFQRRGDQWFYCKTAVASWFH